MLYANWNAVWEAPVGVLYPVDLKKSGSKSPGWRFMSKLDGELTYLPLKPSRDLEGKTHRSFIPVTEAVVVISFVLGVLEYVASPSSFA